MVDAQNYTEPVGSLPAISKTVVQRVQNRLRRNRQFMFVLALLAAVWIATALIINIAVDDLTWPMLIGIFAIFGWLAIYSKVIVPMRVTVTCPSCDELINLNKDWICGSCDAEKSPLAMQTYVRHSLPFESCDECGEAANAIECPHCFVQIPTELLAVDGQPRIARFL